MLAAYSISTCSTFLTKRRGGREKRKGKEEEGKEEESEKEKKERRKKKGRKELSVISMPMYPAKCFYCPTSLLARNSVASFYQGKISLKAPTP